MEDHESERQGTAFFLKEYGLVTCDHAVGINPFIYHPDRPAEKIDVQVVQREPAVDLAILKPLKVVPNFEELSFQSFSSQVQHGDVVTLAGYPGHAPGKSISIKEGQVQSFTIKSGIRRFNISAPIIAGNSGGPILGKAKRVIGIAVTGSDKLETADDTEEHSGIPVSALSHLTSNSRAAQPVSSMDRGLEAVRKTLDSAIDVIPPGASKKPHRRNRKSQRLRPSPS